LNNNLEGASEDAPFFLAEGSIVWAEFDDEKEI
jgi:hypothetical protein